MKKLIIIFLFFIIKNLFSWTIENTKDDFYYNIFANSIFKKIQITIKNEKQYSVIFYILLKDGNEIYKKKETILPNEYQYFEFKDLENKNILLILFYKPKYDDIDFIKIKEISIDMTYK